MIISKTPLRMSFAGGGSDLPAYYKHDDGVVLSTSIDKYMYVAVNRKFDGDIRLSYSITEDVNKVSEIVHPIVRHALELLQIPGGIEISSMADIPSRGSGLGSSSSYTVGLLHALYAYKESYIPKDELAKLASHVEIDLCGDPIGKQDQYAAAFGGLNLIKFHADESVSVEPIICKGEVRKELEESILVFYTGRTRSASQLLSEQSDNMSSGLNRSLTKRMTELAFDMKHVLESGSVELMGEILDANWRLKCQLASGITDSQIDDWYQKGINAGAKGGKLLGAGNGGFMMFFVPLERQREVRETMKDLKEVSFLFENNGSQIVFYQPSGVYKNIEG